VALTVKGGICRDTFYQLHATTYSIGDKMLLSQTILHYGRSCADSTPSYLAHFAILLIPRANSRIAFQSRCRFCQRGEKDYSGKREQHISVGVALVYYEKQV